MNFSSVLLVEYCHRDLEVCVLGAVHRNLYKKATLGAVIERWLKYRGK